jgi:putative addiction module killer protein
MLVVRSTREFDRWLKGLKDRSGRSRILLRLDRLAHGNPGQVAPIGRGLSELKINSGPGYRVYFLRQGDELILLLCGGDKSTQAKDISTAQELARQWQSDQWKGDSGHDNQ